MDSELDVVRQINKLAGQARPVDLMMDLITRYGHWAFLIYGMLLWFAPWPFSFCGIVCPDAGGWHAWQGCLPFPGCLRGCIILRIFLAAALLPRQFMGY